MTAEDKSITGTVEYDATTKIFETVEIPENEVWYIDTFRILPNAEGGNDDVNWYFGVDGADFLEEDGTSTFYIRNLEPGAELTIAPGTLRDESVEIDAYAPGGSEIKLAHNDGESDPGGIIYYALIARRIA